MSKPKIRNNVEIRMLETQKRQGVPFRASLFVYLEFVSDFDIRIHLHGSTP